MEVIIESGRHVINDNNVFACAHKHAQKLVQLVPIKFCLSNWIALQGPTT